MLSVELQISDYNRIILKQFKFIFIVVCVTTIIGLIIGRNIKQTYKATAVIQVDFTRFFEGAHVDYWIMTTMEESLGSMMIDITGYSVLLEAAKLLDKVNDTISLTTVMKDQAIVATIETIRKMIVLKPSAESKQIEIIVTSKIPEEAIAVANAVSISYRDFAYRNKYRFFYNSKNRILKNLEQCRIDMHSTAEQMIKIRTHQQNLIDDDFLEKKQEQIELLERKKQEIDYIQSTITAQRNELLDIQKRFQKNKQQQKTNINTANPSSNNLPDLSWISDLAYQDADLHILNNRLINLRDQYAAYLQFYLPRHPAVLSLNEQLLTTTEELLTALDRIETSFLQKSTKVTARINTISNQLTHQLSDKNTLVWIQNSYQLQEELCESIEADLTEIQMMISGLTPYIDIISEAVHPPESIGLGIKKVVILSIAAGIILGLLLSIFKEMFDRSLSSVEEIRRIFNRYSILSIIPTITLNNQKKKSSKDSAAVFNLNPKILLPVLFNPTAKVSESFQIFAAQLGIHSRQQQCMVIMVTSSIKQEGKTFIAANISLTLALQGYQTLLLETNFRQPAMAPLFGLPSLPGLSHLLVEAKKLDTCRLTISDLILGNFDWSDLTKIHGINNFHCITHGSIPPNPVELFSSSIMTNLMNELKNEYNYIILDCPSATTFADPKVLARYCNGIIMVYRSNGASRELLQTNINNLESTGTNVLGLALNAWRNEVTDFTS